MATGRRAGWVAGAAALGLSVGLAAERAILGRKRIAPRQTLPYDMSTGDRSYRVTSFDGSELWVEETGPKDADVGAIFLHGYCLDSSVWLHQMEAYKGRRLVFFDARGHGGTRAPVGPVGMQTLAEDLAAVLDATKLKKAVIVGHSMGGMTALEFCRNHPAELRDRVKGLALVNTTYADPAKSLAGARLIAPLDRRFWETLNRILENPRTASLGLRDNDFSRVLVRLSGFGPEAPAEQIEHVRRLVSRFPSPGLVELLRGFRAFDVTEDLAKIDVPSLVIGGSQDRIASPAASVYLARELPDSELIIFPKTGHVSMMERHLEFNSALARLFEQTLEPAA